MYTYVYTLTEKTIWEVYSKYTLSIYTKVLEAVQSFVRQYNILLLSFVYFNPAFLIKVYFDNVEWYQ